MHISMALRFFSLLGYKNFGLEYCADKIQGVGKEGMTQRCRYRGHRRIRAKEWPQAGPPEATMS